MLPISRTLLLLLFGLCACSVQAQERTRLGVKLGVTAAELHGDSFSSDARWGLTGSVFAVSPLAGGLDVLVEAGYHAKGTRFEYYFPVSEDLDEFDSGEADSRLDYLFLLAAPQYEGVLGTSGLRLFAFAGPRLDMFLRESFSISVDPPNPRDTPGFAERDFSRFIIGATAGIGLDLDGVLSVPLSIELRYSDDLTSAYSVFSRDNRIRNRAFDLRLGFSF